MPELNREDIIKALRCFSSPPNSCNCIDCYFETKGLCEQNCSTELADAALTLIKQLTDENERLKERADRYLDNLKAVLDERAEENVVDAKIATTKQDVAREIFEEIEKLIIKTNGMWLWQWDLDKIADLKKKYIGE